MAFFIAERAADEQTKTEQEYSQFKNEAEWLYTIDRVARIGTGLRPMATRSIFEASLPWSRAKLGTLFTKNKPTETGEAR